MPCEEGIIASPAEYDTNTARYTVDRAIATVEGKTAVEG